MRVWGRILRCWRRRFKELRNEFRKCILGLRMGSQ